MWRKKAQPSPPTESIQVGNIVGSQGVAIGRDASATAVTADQVNALDHAFAQVSSRYAANHGAVPAEVARALAELQETAGRDQAGGDAARGGDGAETRETIRQGLETIKALAPPALAILGQVLGGLPSLPAAGALLLGEIERVGRAEPPG